MGTPIISLHTEPPTRAPGPALRSSPEPSTTADTILSGIAPLDSREGGLLRGGSYLIVGAPGPSKMVAALQFLHQGVVDGEKSLLVTNADAAGILEVARAWGFDMVDAWREGTLQIVGFRDDFELRAIRSIAPEEVVEELESIIQPGTSRIAVDPGAMFLTGGAKTLLGAAFARWAFNHPGTVLSTLSVDGPAASLPSSADWLQHATTARLLLEPAERGLFELTVARPVPVSGADGPMTLELKPGQGLVEPGVLPGRRGADRGAVDDGKLLLVSLDASEADDLGMWATRAFETDIVSEPFDAVTRLQSDVKYGVVLVHASRKKIRAAAQACRALRPLTRAAIVFASDDEVRSTDRIQILEAGADDCLSGGLDFRELGLRIRQSIAAGAKPVSQVGHVALRTRPSLGRPGSSKKSQPMSVLAAEVERRAADPELSFFCVLEIETKLLDADRLEEILVQCVRHEDGDLVSADDHKLIVLLQGARPSQVEPFLVRLKERMDQQAGRRVADLEVEVLSHPADRARIQMLIGTSGGRES